MSYVQINRKEQARPRLALFNLGFRPFFLGAALFSAISALVWILLYLSVLSIPTGSIANFQWHAHEMVYGYTAAVVAGFLLTAVMNWTGVQTVQGTKLAVLFTLWAAARVLFLFGERLIVAAAIADMMFFAGLMIAIALPIIKVRQWRQLGVLALVLLLLIGNLCFYLGALGWISGAVSLANQGGVYLLITLILVIGGRILPGFIENGVPYEVNLPNPPLLNFGAIVLFVAYAVNQLFINFEPAELSLATAVFAILAYRLFLWHTRGIWSRPLLWSLFLSFGSIAAGLLLSALSVLVVRSPYLELHAFAYGAIGFATLGMMSRVSLGHTGRSIRSPPVGMTHVLRLLLLGLVLRVAVPLFEQQHYIIWVLLSQICWSVAFLLFFALHLRMLLWPRIDGQPG